MSTAPASLALLVDILRREPIDRALVFTRTKRGADKVVRALAKAGLAAEAIHGNKSQGQRERVLAAFRAGRVRTLIATDIAARGIDVEGISHVVNYDLPNIPESYVHRIGRTARAGADWDRDLVLRCRGARVPARHREADPDGDPGDRPPQRSAAAARAARASRQRRRQRRSRRGRNTNRRNGRQHDGKPQAPQRSEPQPQDRRGDHPQQRGSQPTPPPDERPMAAA